MIYPDFTFEQKYWNDGYHVVMGVDEVGRGAFAGPLVAAAAAMKIFNLQFPHKNSISEFSGQAIYNENEKLLDLILKLGINDSKKLTAKRREKLDKEIRKYFHVGIGQAGVGEINNYGIVKATEKAMRRAIRNLIARSTNDQITSYKQFQKSNISKQKNFVLVDAFQVKYIPGIGLKNQKAIVHGDGLSISIAAASIVAKVYRDRLMKMLSTKYTLYGWNRNKGYGTASHRRAIKVYGVCKHHRRDFVEGWK